MCASCHNGVHFFNSSTSRGALLAFWLRNVFRVTAVCITHLNFQTWSETEVFSAFWLRNALRATAAYNFWAFIPPDGSAPAALPFLTFRFSAALEEQRVSRFCYLFTLFDLLCCDSLFSDSLFCLFLWLLLPLLLHLTFVHKSELPSMRRGDV